MRAVEEISSSFWKYQVSRWKCVEENFSTHWTFEVCGRKFFELLKVWSFKCVKESFLHCCKFQVKFQACVIKDLQVIEVFLFKFMWGVKDFLPKLSIFWESVCCSICVQNVFFSNGVLENHGKVWWWQLSSLEVQNAHDAFQTWAFENLLMRVPFCQVKKLQGLITTRKNKGFCITLWTSHGCPTCTHSILWQCEKCVGGSLWCAWS